MPGTSRDVLISDTVHGLRRIFKAIQSYSQDVLSTYGITGPQLWALKIISSTPGLSLSELSKTMYLHPSTVTGVVDRLENKGFVVRDRASRDRRVIKLRLTEKGQELATKTPSPTQGKLIHGLRELKKVELKAVYDVVQKLVEIAEAQDVKVTFFFHDE